MITITIADATRVLADRTRPASASLPSAPAWRLAGALGGSYLLTALVIGAGFFLLAG